METFHMSIENKKQALNQLNSRRGFLRNAPASLAVAVGSVSTAATAAGACKTSDGDILGPFYRPNAKSNVTLIDATTKGDKLKLTGVVLRPDCKTPVANATVDFWHADHSGAYDIKTPDEKIAVENYKFRAITQTDKEGKFTFETVIPGRYGIPPGLEGFEKYAGQTRPAHFHVTITHPIYLPLTTQIYMKGDPFIAKDPWAKHSKNIVTVDKKSASATGQIEIVLANRPGQRA
jgi:catechol 1,2-dioxygenase